MSRFHLLAFAILASSGGAAQAADTAQADFARRVMSTVPGPEHSYACFTRVYDRSHLAQHPLQKVTAMRILIEGWQEKDSTGPSYRFSMDVRRRDRPGLYVTSGECGNARVQEDSGGALRLGCGIDCDGGQVTVAPHTSGKALRVTIGDGISVEPAGRSADLEPDRSSLKPGADDKLFRLDRAKPADCISLASDRKEMLAWIKGQRK